MSKPPANLIPYNEHFAMLSRNEKAELRADPRLGPHEGLIVELMLSGQKPVCVVSKSDLTTDIRALFNATEDGTLVYGGESKVDGTEFYFCQPGQEKNMAKLRVLFESAKEADTDYHIRAGVLLGYTADEIHAFLCFEHQALKKLEEQANAAISQEYQPRPGV